MDNTCSSLSSDEDEVYDFSDSRSDTDVPTQKVGVHGTPSSGARNKTVKALRFISNLLEFVAALATTAQLRVTQTSLEGTSGVEFWGQTGSRALLGDTGGIFSAAEYTSGILSYLYGLVDTPNHKHPRRPKIWRATFILGGLAIMATSMYLMTLAFRSAQEGTSKFGQLMKTTAFKSLIDGLLFFALVSGVILMSTAVGVCVAPLKPAINSAKTNKLSYRALLLAIGIILVGAQFGLDYLANSQVVTAHGLVLSSVLSALAIALGLFVVAPMFFKMAIGGPSTWKFYRDRYAALKASDYADGTVAIDPRGSKTGNFLGRKKIVIPGILVAFSAAAALASLGFWVSSGQQEQMLRLCGGNVALSAALRNLIFCACMAMSMAIMSEVTSFTHSLVKIEQRKSIASLTREMASSKKSQSWAIAWKLTSGFSMLAVAITLGVLPTVLILGQVGTDKLAIFGAEISFSPTMKVALSLTLFFLSFCCARIGGMLVKQGAEIIKLQDEALAGEKGSGDEHQGESQKVVRVKSTSQEYPVLTFVANVTNDRSIGGASRSSTHRSVDNAN